MPTVPKWLANGMEKVFSGMMNTVHVSETEYLDKHLKRVRFTGDLSSTKFVPGKVIEFRISDTEFRHYTPSYFDKEAGICDVLFYLHGYGPGSAWASALKKGDQMKLMGPGGKMSYAYASSRQFFFGDESSLGLCYNLAEEAKQKGHAYKCLLEMETENTAWPGIISLDAETVGKSSPHPAEPAISYLQQLPAAEWEDWKAASYYLSGRAKSIQAIRKALVQKGIGSKQIISMPYWADGKKGL
ncbi:MAG: siderophore-interacting protein [Bacteroidota bacterium]